MTGENHFVWNSVSLGLFKPMTPPVVCRHLLVLLYLVLYYLLDGVPNCLILALDRQRLADLFLSLRLVWYKWRVPSQQGNFKTVYKKER